MEKENCGFRSLDIQGIENPDWGFARTKRCVLMVPSAEWVQSVYSCQFELNGKPMVAPNRDYPYEGLLVHEDGENWKFIDCIALALRTSDGRYLQLLTESDRPIVRVNPWRVTYFYRSLDIGQVDQESKEVLLSISYYLCSQSSQAQVTGCIEVNFFNRLFPDNVDLHLIIQPFIDIRHMYSASDFGGYQISHDQRNNEISVISFNRSLSFFYSCGNLLLFKIPEYTTWWHKLGTGCRQEVCDSSTKKNKTIFLGEKKKIASFFNVEVSLSNSQYPIRLFFCCGMKNFSKDFSLTKLEGIYNESQKEDAEQFQQIETSLNLSQGLEFREAILARVVGWTKFKTYIHLPEADESIKAPYAGAWWFKTSWYRDVFEGILSSIETIARIPEEFANIKKILQIAFYHQNSKNGLILNRIPEYKTLEISYNSTDATLLYFIVAARFIQKTQDVDFGKQILNHAQKVIRAFQQPSGDELYICDGPPRIDDNLGLLLSVPHHSWIDTRFQSVKYAGWEMRNLPNRVSDSLVKDLYDLLGDKESVECTLSSPNFFLPEINAQWIVMLRDLLATAELVERKGNNGKEHKGFKQLTESIQYLLSKAESNYEMLFWNDEKGFLFNLVYRDLSIRDSLDSETAVTAAGMLGTRIFSENELESIWTWTKKKLLQYRKLVLYGNDVLPFGIMTANKNDRIYYDDSEYHSDVVWPRSTPYLIRLLQFLEEKQTIKAILLNNLDHQMAEGAIFYNQELFSKPRGNNPFPEPSTKDNPVPVKNPIQFWSQWCDPYLEFFGNGRR